MNDKSKITRRSALKSMAALAAIGVIPVSRKAYSAKASQASVQYQDKPKGDQQCDNCLQFEAPNACKTVEGKISPKGWCAIWVKMP